jgi:beta-barrel assembly-enhancing protease
MSLFLSTQRYARLFPVVSLCAVLALPASAQTRITADKNSYSPADDVKLGREAADEVRKELPMLGDERVEAWVEDIGRNLVDAIPPEFRHDEFRYSFDVVNQKEINAFALPGGPMFLNRGMVEAAKNEAEVAGVMAHEISHVALRHGTAQATKGQKFQLGALAGQVLGAIVGGNAGSIIAQGSQFGLGAVFLKYGREYERQADLLGAQIMARAGYDPRQMANMFRTIEAEGGGSGPEWLSSHPNPGNRYDAINREAAALQVRGRADTGQFASIKGRLGGMSPAPTAEQIARGQAPRREPVGTGGRAVTRVEAPSTRYRTDQPGNFLRIAIPDNWEQVSRSDAGVTYAPDGGFVTDSGRSAFTHGVQLGVTPGSSGNLQRDTQQLLNSFAQANPRLRQKTEFRRDSIGGRAGLTTTLSNVSEVTGEAEAIQVSTTRLRDGSLLYIIGVAPEREAPTYSSAFQRVRQSVQLSDR